MTDTNNELCPLCNSPLSDPEETRSGKRLQRCSTGKWNSQTREVEGCTYIKWLDAPAQELNEACPKCGSPLVLQTTRRGKRMKKCSTGGWDPENKVATGCDYVEWLGNETKQLNEACPRCDAPLVEMTTGKGKRMKKCSTGGWDAENRMATGCTYVEWLND